MINDDKSINLCCMFWIKIITAYNCTLLSSELDRYYTIHSCFVTDREFKHYKLASGSLPNIPHIEQKNTTRLG